jgi:hypothetical protein
MRDWRPGMIWLVKTLRASFFMRGIQFMGTVRVAVARRAGPKSRYANPRTVPTILLA